MICVYGFESDAVRWQMVTLPSGPGFPAVAGPEWASGTMQAATARNATDA